jgi:glutaredoxin 3
MGSTNSSQTTTTTTKTNELKVDPTLPVHNEYIREAINKNKIVIFSRQSCSWCRRAKDDLRRNNEEFISIEIDDISQCPKGDCQSLVKALMFQTRMNTVPQIFINGQFIGGYSELIKEMPNLRSN